MSCHLVRANHSTSNNPVPPPIAAPIPAPFPPEAAPIPAPTVAPPATSQKYDEGRISRRNLGYSTEAFVDTVRPSGKIISVKTSFSRAGILCERSAMRTASTAPRNRVSAGRTTFPCCLTGLIVIASTWSPMRAVLLLTVLVGRAHSKVPARRLGDDCARAGMAWPKHNKSAQIFVVRAARLPSKL